MYVCMYVHNLTGVREDDYGYRCWVWPDAEGLHISGQGGVGGVASAAVTAGCVPEAAAIGLFGRCGDI